MAIQESAEMYLETIYRLGLKSGHVRSVDVAGELGYSKPSVSRGVGLLKQSGHLVMEADGLLKLTPSGLAAAQKIYLRHVTLSQLLQHLGVTPDTATQDACRMEHIISDETFQAIQAFLAKQTGE